MARIIRLTALLRDEYSAQLVRKKAEQARRQREIDDLVVRHMALVEQIARRVWQRYTRSGQNGYSSHIELSDMISCGYVGLVEAARRYKPAAGEFPQFAQRRIRGAIIDAHRRSAYRDMQHESFEGAEAALDDKDSHRHGGAFERQGGRRKGFSLEITRAIRDTSPLPDEQLAQAEVEDLAVRAIRQLTDDERLVLIDALRGAALPETAQACGRSVAWARAKLAIAREKVAHQVQREQRAA